MNVITRKTLVVTLAALAVSVGSATSFAGSKISPSKGDNFSWGASQEGLWFEEVEITYLMESAMAELTMLQNDLAELMLAMPTKESFKSDKEFRSAVSLWEKAVDQLMDEIEILQDDIDALIIFTTSTDHISKLSGTDLGSGR